MTKNGKDTISLSDIEERKKTLESELTDVHAQIQKLDNMRVQLTAQGNAINGAIQQCDLFLNPNSEASPASSIPSEETNPAVDAVLS
jgi:peptidoglycan hydrolase CwlO-like protein